MFRSHSTLITDYKQPLIPQEDRDLLTNLLGRLKSSAVVTSAMATSINIIHRAAGVEALGNKGTGTSKKVAQPIKRSSNSASFSASKSPSPPPPFIRSDAPILESPTDEDDEGSETATDTDQEQSQDMSDQEELDKSEEEEEDRALPVKTTFLPSLSIGYIPASDDSDPDEELQSFAPLKKPRKNRRGQRERRTIWLKKYGKNARHLQNEKDQGKQKERLSPKDEKQVEGKPYRAKNEVVNESTGDGQRKNEPNVNEMHPSWIAKQKMKEQQKAMLASVKPQKIKFD